MYPSTVSAPKGKLRLLYECNPMAMLMEQAGGLAIDGKQRILDIVPTSIHERSPIFLGCARDVRRIAELYGATIPEPKAAAGGGGGGELPAAKKLKV